MRLVRAGNLNIFMNLKRLFCTLPAAFLLCAGLTFAQDGTAEPVAASASETPVVAPAVVQPAPGAVIPDKRAYGVLPNYRTAESDGPYSPLTVRQKFTIARKDTLDWPSYFTAAMFSGISQLNNSNPAFHQGVEGFAKRYGASAIDQDVGNFLTEAIMPSLLHQDPRYFRKGHGSFMGRVAYAASRTVISKNDKGAWAFNTSEWVGNGMVAALGNLYYPDEVGFNATMQRMLSQVGTDAMSQVLKEFWPDVKRYFVNKRAAKRAAAAAD